MHLRKAAEGVSDATLLRGLDNGAERHCQTQRAVRICTAVYPRWEVFWPTQEPAHPGRESRCDPVVPLVFYP